MAPLNHTIVMISYLSLQHALHGHFKLSPIQWLYLLLENKHKNVTGLVHTSTPLSDDDFQ